MADITVTEASAKCGLSPQHLRYLVKKGLITGRKSGGTWLLDEASLKRYLARPRIC
jgi:excisionase family DNA binding protein